MVAAASVGTRASARPQSPLPTSWLTSLSASRKACTRLPGIGEFAAMAWRRAAKDIGADLRVGGLERRLLGGGRAHVRGGGAQRRKGGERLRPVAGGDGVVDRLRAAAKVVGERRRRGPRGFSVVDLRRRIDVGLRRGARLSRRRSWRRCSSSPSSASVGERRRAGCRRRRARGLERVERLALGQADAFSALIAASRSAGAGRAPAPIPATTPSIACELGVDLGAARRQPSGERVDPLEPRAAASPRRPGRRRRTSAWRRPRASSNSACSAALAGAEATLAIAALARAAAGSHWSSLSSAAAWNCSALGLQLAGRAEQRVVGLDRGGVALLLVGLGEGARRSASARP